jgi:hypothetical protein
LAVKSWNVGDVLTASDMNTWTVPLAGIKSANQTISSQTTLINDADMRFAVAANATYEFHVYLRYSSGTGQDWKSSFTVPAGAACRFQQIGVDISGANFVSVNELTDTSSVTSKGQGVGVIQNAQFMGVLVTAGTTGNLIFQWAQNTSGAFNTTLYASSYLTGRRIA